MLNKILLNIKERLLNRYFIFYLCGEFVEKTDKGPVWYYTGIYVNQKKAIKACKNENYFIVPIKLEDLATRNKKWWYRSIQYPKLEGMNYCPTEQIRGESKLEQKWCTVRI